MVVPVGGKFNIAEEDKLCRDLKLVWVNTFRLLGLDFDSKLEKLHQNYEAKFLVAEDLILKWKRRISIAKSLLLSQSESINISDKKEDSVRRVKSIFPRYFWTLVNKI